MYYFGRIMRRDPRQPSHVLCDQEVLLDTGKKQAIKNCAEYEAKLGCRVFYLPALEAKPFHATHGCTDCVHTSRPNEAQLNRTGGTLGRYKTEEWRKAVTTPITKRLAEVWLVSVRLWEAGLGPQPLWVCSVDRVVRDGRDIDPTCGILSHNVFRLRRKRRCKLDHIIQAGLVPDKIQSCFRQQVRGYVVDLYSVVGCVPEGAEDETNALESVLAHPPFSPINALNLCSSRPFHQKQIPSNQAVNSE